MDSIKALVVDDEKLARQKVLRFLSETAVDIESAEAINGLEALETIATFKPDILFLDIQMPGLTGFEVLQNLEERPFKIIFQTAYDEFAIRAFDENACDYLLKPFTKERFDKAFNRALSQLKKPDYLQNLESTLLEEKKYLERIAVKSGSKIRLIDLNDVTCFMSQDHYTCVYTSEAEFISELSISYLTERLSPDLFLRLHRNNIVRISAIKAVSVGDNMMVELTNSKRLPVSRSCRKKVKDILNQN